MVPVVPEGLMTQEVAYHQRNKLLTQAPHKYLVSDTRRAIGRLQSRPVGKSTVRFPILAKCLSSNSSPEYHSTDRQEGVEGLLLMSETGGLTGCLSLLALSQRSHHAREDGTYICHSRLILIDRLPPGDRPPPHPQASKMLTKQGLSNPTSV